MASEASDKPPYRGREGDLHLPDLVGRLGPSPSWPWSDAGNTWSPGQLELRLEAVAGTLGPVHSLAFVIVVPRSDA
eukprot:942033-Heterocapsa_arctica.AAC.1